MTGPLEIEDGELTENEIIEALEEGQRIVVRMKKFGMPISVTLRYDGTIYYCDTPLTLHRHEEVEEMRQCIRDQGYAKDC